MQFLAILLGLAGTAAAIDARLYYGRGCSGSGVQCGGLNPDTCCPAGGNDYGSVEFRFIPLDWTIEARGHSGGDCANLQERGYPTRVDSICMNIGPFSGAGYGFRNRKRVESASEDCAKLDSVFTEDGANYNIADLDDDAVAQLDGNRSPRRQLHRHPRGVPGFEDPIEPDKMKSEVRLEINY